MSMLMQMQCNYGAKHLRCYKYRPGRLNIVADALSRRDVEEGAAGLLPGDTAAALALSGPLFALLDEVRRATAAAPDGRRLLE
jgi:hypothetical protein